MAINKVKTELKIIEKEEKNYTIKTSNNDKLHIYDKDLINIFIDKKFNKKYEKLLYIVMSIINDEDGTDTDEYLVLEKLSELRGIVLEDYSLYVHKNKINKYLKMIDILEEKLRLSNKKHKRR